MDVSEKLIPKLQKSQNVVFRSILVVALAACSL